MLVLIDLATKYPDAVSLKHIDSFTVAEALLYIYFRVGLPKEILQDQGTQFRSSMLKQLNQLLQIKGINTTTYNPICNGNCEHTNKNFKYIIKKYVITNPNNGISFYSHSCLQHDIYLLNFYNTLLCQLINILNLISYYRITSFRSIYTFIELLNLLTLLVNKYIYLDFILSCHSESRYSIFLFVRCEPGYKLVYLGCDLLQTLNFLENPIFSSHNCACILTVNFIATILNWSVHGVG